MERVKITIDGREVEVPKDTTVIEAAKLLGIEIPALCYDDKLEIVSACRLCLVEVEGSNKLQTSCSLKVWPGMEVKTETDRIVETRKNILQLLLDSHPNDCLTCEKAGECLLQKYAYKYGVKFRSHTGAKREDLVDTSSPYILKDNSKCILCGKCVRTCSQVYDRKVLAFGGRGYDSKIVLDLDKTLEESSCVSCNRCVVACPVGALIDKRQMGKIRPWSAEVRTVSCKVCQYGCEFEVLSKNKEKLAVRAKEPTNGRPLCLKGRLTTELTQLKNPDQVYRKVGGKFVKASWKKVLGLGDIFDKIEELEE